MGSEAPELRAIKDANLRMQREMFRLAAERDALADSVIVRQDEIERLERLTRDLADDIVNLETALAESKDREDRLEIELDGLAGLIEAYRDAREGVCHYHDLPPLTDDELMDDAIREQRNALLDATYKALVSAQDDLTKAVRKREAD